LKAGRCYCPTGHLKEFSIKLLDKKTLKFYIAPVLIKIEKEKSTEAFSSRRVDGRMLSERSRRH
jgi:hypothetical protein